MRFRFTIRSVLAMVLFVAVLLFLLRMGALSRANVKGPAVALLGWLGEYIYIIGGLIFWSVLLMPMWIPLFLMNSDARRQARVCRFLATIPALWYGLSFFVQFFHTMPFFSWSTWNFLFVAFIAAGGLVACPMLAFCARGWWRILVVPLAVAILAATISLEVAAWSAK